MTTSTESDLDRLEQYLDHPERAEVTLPLDAVQELFAAITGQAKELALDNGEDWMSDVEEARLLTQMREGLAGHLVDVRRYWFEKRVPPTVKREGPKVGRNDPCPCGSGRKYKSCHGR